MCNESLCLQKYLIVSFCADTSITFFLLSTYVLFNFIDSGDDLLDDMVAPVKQGASHVEGIKRNQLISPLERYQFISPMKQFSS